MTEIKLCGEDATRRHDIYNGPLQVYNFQCNRISGWTCARSPEAIDKLGGIFFLRYGFV